MILVTWTSEQISGLSWCINNTYLVGFATDLALRFFCWKSFFRSPRQFDGNRVSQFDCGNKRHFTQGASGAENRLRAASDRVSASFRPVRGATLFCIDFRWSFNCFNRLEVSGSFSS